ncbi:MAG: hypothetical protein CM15mP88_2480 [Pseudomonadota bacterium]|nr:MAG: hypothetical protein CM15mP88_2480 [Pseudomonadota bacterium]
MPDLIGAEQKKGSIAEGRLSIRKRRMSYYSFAKPRKKKKEGHLAKWAKTPQEDLHFFVISIISWLIACLCHRFFLEGVETLAQV